MVKLNEHVRAAFIQVRANIVTVILWTCIHHFLVLKIDLAVIQLCD